jgi:dihydrofolate reductase
MISLIAAMAKQRVIGKDNQMPWHMPADLAHFRQVTTGKPVIMGRKTFDSIGRLLPGRRNIIISRQAKPEGIQADWVHSIEQALALVVGIDEVMIIGGGELYKLALPLADRLYITEIDLEVAGDAFFPDFHAQGTWDLIEEHIHQADEKNPHNYKFLTLQRA